MMLVAETILVGAFSFTAFHSFSQGMTLLAFFYILFQSLKGEQITLEYVTGTASLAISTQYLIVPFNLNSLDIVLSPYLHLLYLFLPNSCPFCMFLR